MAINIPELERIPAEQRQAVLEEAAQIVKATHGKMGNVPHYVGATLVCVVVTPLALLDKGILVSVLAGVPVYPASIFFGILLWRRSMHRELRKVVSRIIDARADTSA